MLKIDLKSQIFACFDRSELYLSNHKIHWFLAKNPFNFVSLPWKLDNSYCQNLPLPLHITSGFSESLSLHFELKKNYVVPYLNTYACNELIRSNLEFTNYVFTNLINKYYVICMYIFVLIFLTEKKKHFWTNKIFSWEILVKHLVKTRFICRFVWSEDPLLHYY